MYFGQRCITKSPGLERAIDTTVLWRPAGGWLWRHIGVRFKGWRTSLFSIFCLEGLVSFQNILWRTSLSVFSVWRDSFPFLKKWRQTFWFCKERYHSTRVSPHLHTWYSFRGISRREKGGKSGRKWKGLATPPVFFGNIFLSWRQNWWRGFNQTNNLNKVNYTNLSNWQFISKRYIMLQFLGTKTELASRTGKEQNHVKLLDQWVLLNDPNFSLVKTC